MDFNIFTFCSLLTRSHFALLLSCVLWDENQWILTLSNRMFLFFFHEFPAETHEITKCVWLQRRGWHEDIFRTSQVFLFFLFLRYVDLQAGHRKAWSLFHVFFHFRNVAVVYAPLGILTKCCCGRKEAPIFVFSVFAIFAKCACGLGGVKNSLFTKKHRNRWCV